MEVLKNKGFTLIELIVVIVILGILSVIAAPKFMDLQRDARIAYLNGMKAAIEDANQMLHAYAIIHGLTDLDLRADKRNQYRNAMVKFVGNKVVKTTLDRNDEGVFFLNFGYIATTYGTDRNSGLTQVIGKNAVCNSKDKGCVKTVQNVYAPTKSAQEKACESSDKNIELCYVAIDQQWEQAYVVLKGFSATQCALHYTSATSENNPPKIELITSGC